MWRAIARIWNDLSFVTASGAVDAVRYQPRRLIFTGGRRLAALPGPGPAAVGHVSRGVDGAIDQLVRRIGERLGPDAEAFARWSFGAATGVIDQVGASAIDELGFGDRLAPGMLKPHLHTVGVLVLDMRGFSKLTVTLDDSQYLTDRIDEYLSEMTRVVERHRGVVFDYTGDGLLALFLPELTRKKDDELLAHLAGPVSTELHAAFRELYDRWRADWKATARAGAEIGLGVGITYGPATIGLMGPTGKKYFGIVGPPVNLAAYLCSQALPGTALIDEAAFMRTGASPPPGHKVIRLKSEKLHQRIETIRIRPETGQT